MFCPKCGNNLTDTTKFCGKCGHKCNEVSTVDYSNNILKKIKKKQVITISGIAIVISILLFAGLNLLVMQSEQERFFITKKLGDGSIEKYKMVSLFERVLYSRILEEGTETIEIFYDELGTVEKRVITTENGAMIENYYWAEEIECIRKYYTEEGVIEASFFRVTDRYANEEDVIYDFVKDSIPAKTYPLIAYDKDQEEWHGFIYDVNGNIIQYGVLWNGSEALDENNLVDDKNILINNLWDIYKYSYDNENNLIEVVFGEGDEVIQYYPSGAIKSEYRYDGRETANRVCYYENGAISLKEKSEKFSGTMIVMESYEYDENGIVIRSSKKEEVNGYWEETIEYADGSSESLVWYDHIPVEGNEDKRIKCDSKGRRIRYEDEWSLVEYEYFDETNIEKKVVNYDENGEVTSIFERTREELEDGTVKFLAYTSDNGDEPDNKYLSSEVIYNSSVSTMISSKSYASDGKLRAESTYDDNGNQISYKSYHDDETPEEEWIIENGVKKVWEYNEGRTVYYSEIDVDISGIIGMSPFLSIKYNDDGTYVVTERDRGGDCRTRERSWYNADGSIKKREEYAYMDEGASLSGEVGNRYQKEYDRDALKEEWGTIIYSYNGKNRLVKTDVWTREGNHEVYY